MGAFSVLELLSKVPKIMITQGYVCSLRKWKKYNRRGRARREKRGPKTKKRRRTTMNMGILSTFLCLTRNLQAARKRWQFKSSGWIVPENKHKKAKKPSKSKKGDKKGLVPTEEEALKSYPDVQFNPTLKACR